MYLCTSLKARQYSDAAAAMLDALQMAGREGWQPQSGGSLLSVEEPVQPGGGQQQWQQSATPGQLQGLPLELKQSSRLLLQTIPQRQQQQQQAVAPQQRPLHRRPSVAPQSQVWH